jgi:hypothetical protein
MSFSKSIRQRIVREFAVRHNGQYNPSLFLEEVRQRGPARSVSSGTRACWRQGR